MAKKQTTGYIDPNTHEFIPVKKKRKIWPLVLVAVFAVGILYAAISSANEEKTAPVAETTAETEEEQDAPETDAPETDTPETEPPKSQEEIRAEFIASCVSPDYKDVMRYPDSYKDKPVSFTGKVIQTREDTSLFTGKTITLRVRDKDDPDIVWLVQYKAKDVTTDGNILEDDYITIYGNCAGTTSYTTILGAQVTVPSMVAVYIDREETP